MEIIKKNIIIMGVMILIALIVIVIVFNFKPNSLEYEYVYEIPVEYDETKNTYEPWLTFVNEEYSPMMSVENLLNDYGVILPILTTILIMKITAILLVMVTDCRNFHLDIAMLYNEMYC